MDIPHEGISLPQIQDVSSSQVPDVNMQSPQADDDRRRAAISSQFQQGQHVFAVMFRGLTKIFEEILSLVFRR